MMSEELKRRTAGLHPQLDCDLVARVTSCYIAELESANAELKRWSCAFASDNPAKGINEIVTETLELRSAESAARREIDELRERVDKLVEDLGERDGIIQELREELESLKGGE